MKKGFFFFGTLAWGLALATAAWATYFDTGWVEFRQPKEDDEDG